MTTSQDPPKTQDCRREAMKQEVRPGQQETGSDVMVPAGPEARALNRK